MNLSPLASIANLLNYAYGTTRLELAAFLPATAISIVPRTFATVQAGALGASSLDGEASGLGAFTLVAAVRARGACARATAADLHGGALQRESLRPMCRCWQPCT